MNLSKLTNPIFLSQISVGLIIGVVAACAPTRFSEATNPTSVCDSKVTSCIVTNGYLEIVENFKVGAGKVDILFVDDNSASMSFEQVNLAAKFGGFIEQLDQKQIDYKIAVITTDLAATQNKRFVTFGNGQSFLTPTDANRVGLFNSAIARPETIQCESFIKTAIYNYGSAWRSSSAYAAGYNQNCPSPDERGLFTSSLVLSENTENFMRADAHLNVILISDEDERSGEKNIYESSDRFDSFTSMMNEKYSAKYWDFNSIIVKDSSCAYIQDHQILDLQGRSAVGSSVGDEYARLSNSAARDINNNPRPRGLILDICQNDYSQHFGNIATQISAASRLMTLRCKPLETPVVTAAGNSSMAIPHTWDGNQSIVFDAGSEGIPAIIKYRCYRGAQ